MLVSLLSLFDDLYKTPAFIFAEVSRLGDENGISYSAFVVFVMRFEFFGLVDGLLLFLSMTSAIFQSSVKPF